LGGVRIIYFFLNTFTAPNVTSSTAPPKINHPAELSLFFGVVDAGVGAGVVSGSEEEAGSFVGAGISLILFAISGV
jgi:hypothetical protein